MVFLNLIIYIVILSTCPFLHVVGQAVNIIQLAGTGTAGLKDGPAASAQFSSWIGGISVNTVNEDVYLADTGNHRIRKISALAQVSTIAGGGSLVDGQGTFATFNQPTQLFVDSFLNVLYIGDEANGRVRKITADGYVSTLFGTGAASNTDGYGTYATILGPNGVVLDSSGKNLFAVSHNGHSIRKMNLTTREVTTFAGSGSVGGADNVGLAASFNGPWGLAIDINSNLYVSEAWASRVRKVTPTGSVSTLVSSGIYGNYGICSDRSGNVIYIGDTGNGQLKRFASNALTTYASVPGIYGCAVDSWGGVLAGDNTGRIWRFIACTSSSYFDSTLGSCACTAGLELQLNNICTSCLSGYYQPTGGKQACLLCPPGTESNSLRTACTSCAAGKYRNGTMSVCTDCPLGYETSVNKDSCVPCPSGFYRSSNSTLVCVPCPVNANCNLTSFTCSPSYKFNSSKTGCDQCPIGTQPSLDFLTCVNCTLGSTYRSSLSQPSCLPCPLRSNCSITGFICNAGSEPTCDGYGCSQCLEGYFKSGTGNGYCVPCPVGTESAANKQSCVTCSTGKYRPDTAINRCIPCPRYGNCTTSSLNCTTGFILNAGGDGCDQCPPGQESADGLDCIPCNSGYFKPDQSYQTCIKCPEGSSCGASSVSCQIGYFYDFSAQCKRNDTYFSLMQTATTVSSFLTITHTSTSVSTSISTSVSTTRIYATATVSNIQTATVNNGAQLQTITVSAGVQTVIISSEIQTVTVTSSVDGSIQQQQAQSANSVNLDFINMTLPISPLIFSAIAFGAGFMIMFILSLICCRKSPQHRKYDDYDGVTGMTTTGMNTQSQRTFTNSSMTR